jgi:hypothetical protein
VADATALRIEGCAQQYRAATQAAARVLSRYLDPQIGSADDAECPAPGPMYRWRSAGGAGGLVKRCWEPVAL